MQPCELCNITLDVRRNREMYICYGACRMGDDTEVERLERAVRKAIAPSPIRGGAGVTWALERIRSKVNPFNADTPEQVLCEQLFIQQAKQGDCEAELLIAQKDLRAAQVNHKRTSRALQQLLGIELTEDSL